MFEDMSLLLRDAGYHKCNLVVNFLRSSLIHCLRVNHGTVYLQVPFHSTKSKCSVNQMEFILGIVCHLDGITLYTALITDWKGKP